MRADDVEYQEERGICGLVICEVSVTTREYKVEFLGVSEDALERLIVREWMKWVLRVIYVP